MNNRLAIALFVISTLLPISAFSEEFNMVGNKLPYMKNINSDVQLKNNGWLKILSEDVVVLTPEKYQRLYIQNKDESSIERSVKYRREDARRMGYNENYRILFVKVQFLNYCKASVDKEEVEKHDKKTDELFNIGIDKMVARYPDFDFVTHTLEGAVINIPRFRCNYRTTLMTSYYSISGEEIRTDKFIPPAQRESKNKINNEIFPGENITTGPFIIPDEARYWYVWVPK